LKIFVSGNEGNIGHAIEEFYRKPNNTIINDILEVDALKTYVRRGEMSNEYFNGENVREIDVTNNDVLKFIFEKYRPEIVIHCGALVGTEKAEKFAASAKDVNIQGTKNIATLAKEYNSYFVNFSTTATMDTSKYSLTNPITEITPRKPHTIYGQTKLDAELAAKKILGDKMLNLLPIFIFSRYPHDNSSEITKIYTAFVTKKIRTVKMALYNVKNYFWIDDAVDAITRLIARRITGDFVISNNFENSKTLNQTIVEMAAAANVSPYELLSVLEFNSSADYLGNHVGDTSKLLNEIGDLRITAPKNAFREVYASVIAQQNLSKD